MAVILTNFSINTQNRTSEKLVGVMENFSINTKSRYVSKLVGAMEVFSLTPTGYNGEDLPQDDSFDTRNLPWSVRTSSNWHMGERRFGVSKIRKGDEPVG